MAISQSVVRIYSDSALTSLVETLNVSGGATIASATGLSAGTRYFATVQITTTDSQTTAESAAYPFYTLPNVNFSPNSPTGGNGTITAELTVTTVDVAAYRIGIIYSTHSDFSDAESYDELIGSSRYLNVYNLEKNTTYYVKPYVIDEFGRIWVNDAAAVSVVTGYGVPVVNWTGMAAVSSTVYDASVNITSSGPLTSVVAVYTPLGGQSQTIALLEQTGTQSVSLTGLTPGTQYSLYVRATNAAGYGDSITVNFTTVASGITLELTNVSVSNQNNIISATSTASYDSNTITITGHWIELYSNDLHNGNADESVSGGAVVTLTNNLSHADPDETYYVFSRVTYTVGNDPTVLTAWSEPWEVATYSLLSFGEIAVTNTTADVNYMTDGSADSIDISYSDDGENWIRVPVSNLSGGTVSITGLSPNTTYYLRGRCQSAAGWQDYISGSFTTDCVASAIEITSISSGYTTANIRANIY